MSLIEKIDELERHLVKNNCYFEGAEWLFGKVREAILSSQKEPIGNTEEMKEPCGWCKENYRFEFNWIDDDGNTVTEDNIVIGGVAEHCPVCGRPLNQPYTE